MRRGSTKGVCVIEDDEEKQRCVATMQGALGPAARVTWSLPMFVEIVNPAVSKARAVDVALERFDASLERSLAIGDAPNDIEMLDAAGFAVAVSSAHESVLRRADATCAGPEDAGVAECLEALGLC